MGNCVEKSLKSTAEIVPCSASAAPAVRLYGSPTSAITTYIRFALLYKSVNLNFVHSETPHFGSETPVIQIGSETVSGSRETLLQYIDARFPHPPLLQPNGLEDDDRTKTLEVARLTAMQHRSMMWHLERLVRWAGDLATRGGKRTVDPAVGSPKMEIKKLAKSYSQMLELMLEHAQMEEKVLFPILEMADRGSCKTANEEHARDLPIMNGIKEDIKTIGVLDYGSPVYQEVLLNLSKRLKSFLAHCKQHFMEEEKDLLPLLEAAAELYKEEQKKLMEKFLEVMKGTHSHSLNFLLEGLIPKEALLYLDLISQHDLSSTL